MSKHLYYALFDPEDEGGYCVTFPDLPGCITCGADMSDALYMARDALDGWMIGIEDDRKEIPVPTSPTDIDIPKGVLLIPIESDTKLARIKFNNKTIIKKSRTLLYWLNEITERHHVDFSMILQDALLSHLDLDQTCTYKSHSSIDT